MKQENRKYCYRYPHPALTADCVIFGFDGHDIKVLLIERGYEPYKGMWALPGGFMNINETIEQAATRELHEETGLHGIYLTQFKVFSGVKRDPRERVVTVAFIALVRPELYCLAAGSDASDARWFNLDFLPPMAFDHNEIIDEAHIHLCEQLQTKPIAFELLNKQFTMSELQRVYEAITGKRYDRRNFQRKAILSGWMEEVQAEEEKNMSMYDMLEPEPPIKARTSGRPSNKIFKFLRKKKETPEDDDNDGSIKDLFNF